MPFPSGVETVTVTAGAAGYRHPDGTPYEGTVRITPSVSRVTSAQYGVIMLGTINATLGASGTFTTNPVLLATDADDFEPSGWTYRIDEEFTNAPGRAYYIRLPAAVTPVALPTIAPVESSAGTTPADAVLSVNGETGIVVLDAADVGADAAGTAAAAVAVHAADTTAVHGITDTAALETTAGATAKVSAHAAAADPHGDRAVAAAALATHEADTTNVHGIADTAALETQAGATAKVTTHAGAADPHGDRAYADTKLAKSSNLSDVASAGTARTNLGLGTAAVANVGTAAGTVAAGDDSRITGAAQKSANLSDLASASTARTNLGLGDAATKNVGTTAGTVAAGDDSRLSDARTPTAHASSHGSGGSDPVTLAQSQITGLVSALAGKMAGAGTVTDNAVARYDGTGGVTVQNSTLIVNDDGSVVITGNLTDAGNLLVRDSNTSPTKGYRFRTSGGALDTEAGGADWFISVFPNADFSGTQRDYFRMESGAAILHVSAEAQFNASPFGGRVHTLDGVANKLGFHGVTPVARQTVTGSRLSGAALADLLTKLANLGLIVDGTTA